MLLGPRERNAFIVCTRAMVRQALAESSAAGRGGARK
jgi:hypothetical protein